MTEDFFGYDTASPMYDKRRHINVIFQLLMMYKLKACPNSIIPKLQYALQCSTMEAAEIICNDILTYDEHNYLNLLRERYCLNDNDFVKIMSGYGCTLRENKTPAGYTIRQNQELFVQMLNSRYYMQPQNDSAFMYINSVIAGWGGSMKGISLTQAVFNRYDQLWRRALALYPTNYQMKEIEDYVIDNL